MGKKTYSPEQIISYLREAEILHAKGSIYEKPRYYMQKEARYLRYVKS